MDYVNAVPFLSKTEWSAGRRDSHFLRPRSVSSSTSRSQRSPLESLWCHLSVGDQSTYAGARASRKGTKAILIGHKGHPEVEGTMGQYSNHEGGIYLIESIEDIANLPVSHNDDLTFMTQTTLSLDDTADTISALKENTLRFKVHIKTTFVMLQPIVNKRCANWQNNRI